MSIFLFILLGLACFAAYKVRSFRKQLAAGCDQMLSILDSGRAK